MEYLTLLMKNQKLTELLEPYVDQHVYQYLEQFEPNEHFLLAVMFFVSLQHDILILCSYKSFVLLGSVTLIIQLPPPSLQLTYS